ncbi:hypothetical protein TorRG33x02_256410, partial [Trema orientale]
MLGFGLSTTLSFTLRPEKLIWSGLALGNLEGGIESFGFGLGNGGSWGLATELDYINPFAETELVLIYTGCGRNMEAQMVFDLMSNRDVISWNITIDG